MPLKLAVNMAARNKGGATQPAAQSGSSRQSGSGAPQPAALSSTLQTLVDHMRVFITDHKKWPKHTKGKSEDERSRKQTGEAIGNRLIEEPTELRMHSLCSFSWWEKYLAVRVLCWDNLNSKKSILISRTTTSCDFQFN